MTTIEYWANSKTNKKIKSNNAYDIFWKNDYFKELTGKTIVTINQTLSGFKLAIDNTVYALTDNLNYCNYFNAKYKNNKTNDQAFYCSYNDKGIPIGCIYIIEVLERMKKNGLHIDYIIANLPYGQIYIEILKKLMDYIDDGLIDKIIAINPATPWNSKQYYALHKENCIKLFKHFDFKNSKIIEHDEFCKKLFDIGNAVPGNGIIAAFNKEIINVDESIIIDFLFEKDKIFKSILTKIANKMQKTIASMTGGDRKDHKRSDYKRYIKYIDMPYQSKIYSWHETKDYKDSILCVTGKAGSIIGFNTRKEQLNFENSLKTWVYKIVFDACIDDPAKIMCLAPWLGDYTEEWTDEKLFNYFNINDEEKEYIKSYMLK